MALSLPQKQIPDFHLPEQFQADVWEIMEWNKYKNSNRSAKAAWRVRSNITENKLDLSGIENEVIREELKYFMYYLYDQKNVTLTTFAEYYDRIKLLREYVNTLSISSILDIKDLSDYEKFIGQKGNKTTVDNGSAVIGMEIKKTKRTSRFITFLSHVQEIVEEYYTKDIPEREKLVWHYDKLPNTKGKSPGKTLDFRDIQNKEFLKLAQDFCYFLLPTVVLGTVYKYLFSLKVLFEWLDNNHSEIKHLTALNRDILEEFFLYLRTESKYLSNQQNTIILNLKKFFEWGQLTKASTMPQEHLILAQDYTFKTKKSSKYLEDDEMKNIISIISKLKDPYGKIIYLLIFTGMRISELLELSVDSLIKNADGTYALNIQQYKTNKEYIKPLDERPAKIILSQIEKNFKKFAAENVKYVFVNDKNKPFTTDTINRNLRKIIIENNIKGRDGKLLHCTTHMFRATLATKLVSSGKDPELVAKLLGQSTLSALSYYAAVDPKTAKEQLAPRIAKDQIMISNIGKLESEQEQIPETAIPLCNGFCCKNIETGICKKANTCLNCPMFIPSQQFINSYELQLQETLATIAIAQSCGYEKLLENSLETKKQLESILSKLKDYGGEDDE